jgi:hypothetical protein
MHEPMLALLWPALVLVMLVEMALVFVAPALYARIALLPTKLDRRLTVPFERVSSGVNPMINYDGQDHTGGWSEGGSFAWVRPRFKWFGFNRSIGIGRVDVRVLPAEAGGAPPYRAANEPPTARVEIRARWMPVPATLPLIFPIFLVAFAVGDPVKGLIFAVVLLFTVALSFGMTYARVQPALSMVAERIEADLTKTTQGWAGAGLG